MMVFDDEQAESRLPDMLWTTVGYILQQRPPKIRTKLTVALVIYNTYL